ncbi:hypothetical protein D3C87_1037390 [compost metagenome]
MNSQNIDVPMIISNYYLQCKIISFIKLKSLMKLKYVNKNYMIVIVYNRFIIYVNSCVKLIPITDPYNFYRKLNINII